MSNGGVSGSSAERNSMKIIQELLPGVFVLRSQKFQDERGFLSIPFNAKNLPNRIGQFQIAQTMYTVSNKSVLRGLHFQDHTSPIAKLISCTSGAIYDVVVDLRRQSKTFGQWAGIHLDETDTLQVFAPVGIAHGFVALVEFSGVFYYQAGDYNAETSCILSWDDPDLAIEWTIRDPILSDRDRGGMSWQTYIKNPIF
jgi:dTDP-4-dehydrorhamnose 3,5-epimerase